MTKLFEIRIRGLRTLVDVSVTFDGLTVLIGDNGTGKSSLLEALRIVRLIPGGKLLEELHHLHSIGSAIRTDGVGLSLDVRFAYNREQYVYSIQLASDAQSIAVETLAKMPGMGHSIAAGSALRLVELPLILHRVGRRIENSKQLGFFSEQIDARSALLA